MGSSFVPVSAYTGLHQTFTDQGSQPPLRLLAALPCIIDVHLITHPPDCPASEWLTELRTVCLTCVLCVDFLSTVGSYRLGFTLGLAGWVGVIIAFMECLYATIYKFYKYTLIKLCVWNVCISIYLSYKL